MKFVSKTGFGLLSLTAPLVLLCGCDRANHYEKGMEWVAKKDYSHALVEMRKAMAKDQGTADTYYQAGVAAMELSANADAKRYLDAADNLAGPRSKLDLDIKARLASLALLRRDFKDSRDLAKWVLDRDPKNAKAHEVLVFSLTALSQPEQAAQEMDLWLASDPSSQRERMVRSAISLSKEDLPEAIKQLEDAAAQQNHTAQTLVSLGNLYQAAGNYAKAQEAYQKGAEIDPGDIEPRKGMAWMYARMGKLDKAHEEFRHIAEVKPDDPEARGALAAFFMAQHRLNEAIAEMERLTKQYPKDVYNRGRLAAAYLLTGQRARSRELVNTLIKEDPSNPQHTLLAGILDFQDGQVDKAIVELNNSMEYRPSAIALYFIGACQDRKGDMQQAQVAMTRALRMDPDLIGARLWLAEYWLQQSAPTTALTMLQQDPQAKNPPPVEQLLLTRVYSAMGHYDLASKEMDDLRAKHPNSVPAYYADALRFLNKRQWAQARGALEQALDHDPSAINMLSVIVQCYFAEGKPKDAVERVRKQVERFPKSYVHFQLLAETERAAGDYGSAKVAFERAIALSPESPGPVLGLVQTLVVSGRNEDARIKINDLVHHWPQWAQSWILYAGFMENQGDYPEATNGYEKAVALDSGNGLALNNLAWRIFSDGGDMDRALQMAQKAHEAEPNNAAYADTLAMIYMRVGSKPEAEKVMLNAVKLQPRNPIFLQHLAAIQKQR